MTSQFEVDGFLSDLSNVIAVNNREYADRFQFARDLNRLGMRILYQTAAAESVSADWISLVLLGRALQAFQAAILLLERGMVPDASGSARHVCEALIVAGGLRADETLPQRIVSAYELHKKKMGHAILASKDLLDLFNPDTLSSVRARVESLGDKKLDDLKLEQIAMKAGLLDVYTMYYRQLSGDGAHITAGTLEHHMIGNADDIAELQMEPSDRGLDFVLLASISCLFGVVREIRARFGLDALEAEWAAISERFNAEKLR